MYAYIGGFALAFYLVIKSADFAIEYVTRLARHFGISEFAISFLLIGLVAALPETIIGFSAAAQGKHDIAVIALLASDVVDLTFVFGVVALFASGLHVSAPVIKREVVYLILLALPLVLGYDGTISRAEGIALLLAGLAFIGSIASEHKVFSSRIKREDFAVTLRTIILLIISVLVMVVSANFTVSFLSLGAAILGVPAPLVAVFVIGLGSCLPELLFTIRSLQKHKYEMALGNVLGVVIIDATIMLGLVAVFYPLTVDPTLLRVTGLFCFIGALALLYFLKIHQKLSRWEAAILLGIYACFAAVQFIIH